MTDPIYHLAAPGDWAASTDEYEPADLEVEGFIHCSTRDQLPEVARERFIHRNDLVLLTIDPGPLGGTVIYEDLHEAGEEFPHIYGPLPTSAVLSTGPYLEHLEEGMWLETTRNDPDWMDVMLHPDFEEVGMSGRTYSRAESVDVSDSTSEKLVARPPETYQMDLIDEDVALVRYISHDTVGDVERVAHRTSIWVNTNEGWRLRFHQGTPLPSD